MVAIGSSTTEGAGASAPQFNYVGQLDTALRKALPDTAVTVKNAGVGGQNLAQILNRFPRDVYAATPEVVILQTGINDLLQNRDLETFRNELATAIASLKRQDYVVGLIGIQYMGASALERYPRLPLYEDAMREAAVRFDVTYINRYDLVRTLVEDEGNPLTAYQSDELHHNDAGYRLLAGCVARAMFSLRPTE